MIYYILWILNFIITKTAFKPIINGRENIPKKGGAVIAADHSDISDPLFLCMSTKRRLYYYVTHFYYIGEGGPVYHRFAFILRWTNQIPVIIGKSKSDIFIDKAVDLISKGRLFVIFPEGTTKGGEEFTTIHRGVARIALKAKVPVIPIGIINTEGILPKGKGFFQKYPKVKVNIGKPLYYGKYYGKHNDKKITKLVANDVMKHIKKLCNEAKSL